MDASKSTIREKAGKPWSLITCDKARGEAVLEKIKFDNFTAFERLEVELSPGINIFIGENGTGKTHILKAGYAACDIGDSKGDFAKKINDVFFSSGRQIGRLVRHSRDKQKGSLEISRKVNSGKELKLKLSISTIMKNVDGAEVSGSPEIWMDCPLETAYIPVEDMMANAQGLRSLNGEGDIHFEKVHVDMVRKAFLPASKEPVDQDKQGLLNGLQDAMGGRVILKKGKFFLENKSGQLEFTLLAEGYRKLGLLWLLIQNGTLLNGSKGSVLFWDEPETNLHPKLMRSIVEALIKLQRMGVQILLATHDDVIMKEFDLQSTQEDNVVYHSLYRDKENELVKINSTEDYLRVLPNAIDDAYGTIIDREIDRAMGGLGK